MKKFYLLPVLFVLLLSASLRHKFYVSVTTLTYNDKHFEIILYTFPDDLEKAVSDNFGYTIDLDHPDPETKFYIETYLKEKFKIYVNGKEADYTYLGYTFENEKILLLMETDRLRKIKRVKIVQEWLTDIYPEQQNIVHLIFEEQKFSKILTKDDVVFDVEVAK